MRDGGPQVLANLNRLADTRQTTLPVHDTLDHFIGHVRRAGWEQLRRRCVQRLLRMKALDAARLLGHPVLLLDATGLLCFHRRHCPHCLTQRHGKQTLYFHHVLEAKLLGPGGVVVSLDSEFIDNADAADAKGKSAEQIKQDCELKAAQRLLPRIKKDYPQLRFVLALDNLYACGTLFALAQELGWSFVVTFKEGRTPALWREYQALRSACPENTLRRVWDDRVQEFRWVKQLAYEDSEGRQWQLNALECTEQPVKGEPHYFAWLTGLPVGKKTVEEIAQKGGRYRWKIENEGFNRQKNSGLNLEHVYSTDPENWKVYYLLLQIAFLLTAIAGAWEPVAAVGGGGGAAVLEAVRQPEECGAAVAGQCAFRGVGRELVRPTPDGEVADRVGQFVGVGARRLLRVMQRLPQGFGEGRPQATAFGMRAVRGCDGRPAVLICVATVLNAGGDG